MEEKKVMNEVLVDFFCKQSYRRKKKNQQPEDTMQMKAPISQQSKQPQDNREAARDLGSPQKDVRSGSAEVSTSHPEARLTHQARTGHHLQFNGAGSPLPGSLWERVTAGGEGNKRKTCKVIFQALLWHSSH